MLVPLLLLLGLLITGSFGPGWWLVRRLRWSLTERFVAAVAASGIVLYLAAFALYGLAAPRAAYWAVSAVGVGLGLAAWRDVRRLLRDRAMRRLLGVFGLLFIWMLLLLAMVRGYSGGAWEIDWLEHFQRVQFFLQHQPVDTRFAAGLPLPSRPPFMNLLAGFYLEQAGQRYDLFQVTMVWFNLLAYFPAWLLVRRLRPRGATRTGLLALVVLLAASPVVVENATYTWTKGFTNFHVLLGLVLYARAMRRPDPHRMLAAFLTLSAGVLVHYSAAPYFILVLLHYLSSWRRRRTPWTEAGRMAAGCTLLLGTWIGWALFTYGPAVTFGSNTTAVGASAMTTAQNLAKIGGNLVTSVVPHPLRIGWTEFTGTFVQTNPWGVLRDYFFMMVQTNLLLGLGSLGWVAVGWVLWRQRRAGGQEGRAERWFWFGLAGAGAVLTIATHPTADAYGVAHVCSQPLLWLGLCLLAAYLGTLPRWLRWVVVAGCGVDFLLGGLLHFSLQHWVYELTPRIGRDLLVFRGDMLNLWAARNLSSKQSAGFTFWGDHFAALLPGLQIALLALFALLLDRLVCTLLGRGRLGRGLVLALLFVAAGIFLSDAPARTRPILPVPAEASAASAAVTNAFDSGDAHFNLGLADYLEGRMGEGVLEMVHALVLQPEHALARYCFELFVTVYRGPIPPAVPQAEAVRLNPASAIAQNNLAVELRIRGHVALADSRLRESIRLEPDFVAALNNLARSEFERGRVEAATELLTRSLRVAPGISKTHLLLAKILLLRGSLPEGMAELRETLRLDPEEAEAAALLARAEQGAR